MHGQCTPRQRRLWTEENVWSNLIVSGECRLWGGSRHPVGYGALRFRGKSTLAHRLAWTLATGRPIPDGMRVCHTCDVRLCVRHDGEGTYEVGGVLYERRGHLWLGTQAANLADMVAKGRSGIGERHISRLHPEVLRRGEQSHYAKLSNADVLEIRSLYRAGGVYQRELAVRFGVDRGTISMVVNGNTWKHLT